MKNEAYTTQADIEAMMNAYKKQEESGESHATVSDYEYSYMSAALSASPVHAELARVKAENEGLRYGIKMAMKYLDANDIPGAQHRLRNAAKQALQTKGGE